MKKKLLLVALIVVFVFAHPWESQAIDNRGHPWEGDRPTLVEEITEPDGEGISFTVPSVVVDVIAIIAPCLVSKPNVGCPGELICGWVFDREWKWRCICTNGHLK